MEEAGTDADGEASGSVGCHKIAICACTDTDDARPSKSTIKERQIKALVEEAPVDEANTSCGKSRCDVEGLFHGAKQIIIPADDKHLQAELVVCANMGGSGHRGKASTLHALRPYCVWAYMKADVGECFHQRLHCVDSKVGELKPRSLEERMHGDGAGKVIQFEFLHVGLTGRWENMA